eukprot:5035878-Amphidinium_carterae.1
METDDEPQVNNAEGNAAAQSISSGSSVPHSGIFNGWSDNGVNREHDVGLNRQSTMLTIGEATITGRCVNPGLPEECDTHSQSVRVNCEISANHQGH